MSPEMYVTDQPAWSWGEGTFRMKRLAGNEGGTGAGVVQAPVWSAPTQASQGCAWPTSRSCWVCLLAGTPMGEELLLCTSDSGPPGEQCVISFCPQDSPPLPARITCRSDTVLLPPPSCPGTGKTRLRRGCAWLETLTIGRGSRRRMHDCPLPPLLSHTLWLCLGRPSPPPMGTGSPPLREPLWALSRGACQRAAPPSAWVWGFASVRLRGREGPAQNGSHWRGSVLPPWLPALHSWAVNIHVRVGYYPGRAARRSPWAMRDICKRVLLSKGVCDIAFRKVSH